jgi:hypothetical protein
MACLLNGMTLLAVSPEFKFIARGAVLSLAVWMDVRLRDRRRGAGASRGYSYFGICGFVPHLLGSGPILKVSVPPALTAL